MIFKIFTLYTNIWNSSKKCLRRLLLNLRHPRDFTPYHIPLGNLVLFCNFSVVALTPFRHPAGKTDHEKFNGFSRVRSLLTPVGSGQPDPT